MGLEIGVPPDAMTTQMFMEFDAESRYLVRAKRGHDKTADQRMPDFLVLDVLHPDACAAILTQLRNAAGTAAGVYGMAPKQTIAPRVRSVTQLVAPAAVRSLIEANLEAVKPELARHFAIDLGVFEEPQFLRYRPGDFFVAHQDGNTPLLFDESRFRRISITLFLNEQSQFDWPETFDGGSLVLHGRDATETIAARPGTLVAFRSETTHEVTPVTRGERYSIVSWCRAPDSGG